MRWEEKILGQEILNGSIAFFLCDTGDESQGFLHTRQARYLPHSYIFGPLSGAFSVSSDSSSIFNRTLRLAPALESSTFTDCRLLSGYAWHSHPNLTLFQQCGLFYIMSISGTAYLKRGPERQLLHPMLYCYGCCSVRGRQHEGEWHSNGGLIRCA